MIISGTPSVLVDVSATRKNESSKTNETVEQHQQKSTTATIQKLNDQHSLFSQFDMPIYAFKQQPSYGANLALKQYLDYDSLERRQAVTESFGVSLYA